LSLFRVLIAKIPFFFGESDEEREEEFKEIEGRTGECASAAIWQSVHGKAELGKPRRVSSILKMAKKFKIKRAAMGSFMLVLNNTGIHKTGQLGHPPLLQGT
jgi:uncharacterized protein with PhoU and TrkA domain